MEYLYIKSLHIIFVVTWFAGLFYIVRLFIYQTEALNKEEPDRTILSKQLAIMSKRLWFIITWPSAILTVILGTTLLVLQPAWLKQPFMHVKLSFVFLLLGYQVACQKLYQQLQRGIAKYSSTQLRIFNEVSTIILFAVVFLIVLKDEISWIWAILSLVGLGVVLMVAIRIYKKKREKRRA
ncbi:MAG: CopD family protein [Bacteroidota bacterium]